MHKCKLYFESLAQTYLLRTQTKVLISWLFKIGHLFKFFIRQRTTSPFKYFLLKFYPAYLKNLIQLLESVVNKKAPHIFIKSFWSDSVIGLIEQFIKFDFWPEHLSCYLDDALSIRRPWINHFLKSHSLHCSEPCLIGQLQFFTIIYDFTDLTSCSLYWMCYWCCCH